MKREPAPYRPPSEHYENFPVASWLCPPHLRPPIAAVYWFARTADDIADEGPAGAAQRLTELALYRADLLAIGLGQPHSGRWPRVFDPLARELARFRLPLPLLQDLLAAFEQDIVFTDQHRRYQTDAELHDYCSRSANPVGRLLLHLYGVTDPAAVKRSDLICTALQLINFWQDLRLDIARSRWYPSTEQMQRHQVTDTDLQRDAECPRASAMLATYVADAAAMMRDGAPLARQLPGRGGWELRLVIQGGLRVVEKMQRMHHATWRSRPKLEKADVPLLLWRAWQMPALDPQAWPA